MRPSCRGRARSGHGVQLRAPERGATTEGGAPSSQTPPSLRTQMVRECLPSWTPTAKRLSPTFSSDCTCSPGRSNADTASHDVSGAGARKQSDDGFSSSPGASPLVATRRVGGADAQDASQNPRMAVHPNHRIIRRSSAKPSDQRYCRSSAGARGNPQGDRRVPPNAKACWAADARSSPRGIARRSLVSFVTRFRIAGVIRVGAASTIVSAPAFDPAVSVEAKERDADPTREPKAHGAPPPSRSPPRASEPGANLREPRAHHRDRPSRATPRGDGRQGAQR